MVPYKFHQYGVEPVSNYISHSNWGLPDASSKFRVHGLPSDGQTTRIWMSMDREVKMLMRVKSLTFATIHLQFEDVTNQNNSNPLQKCGSRPRAGM